jgi:hypothetical protein
VREVLHDEYIAGVLAVDHQIAASAPIIADYRSGSALMSLLSWIIWLATMWRGPQASAQGAVRVVTELRCVEADEPNALAEGVDGIAVNDVNVAGFYGVTLLS